MIPDPITIDGQPRRAVERDLNIWREAGAALGGAHAVTRRSVRIRAAQPGRRRMQEFISRAATAPPTENTACLLDNFRLLLTADKEGRELTSARRDLQVFEEGPESGTAVVCVLARAYLKISENGFEEEELQAFIEGYQETADLSLEEIWAIKPAMQRVLADRLMEADPGDWPALVASLRKICDLLWRDFVEAVSFTHRVLARDPAGAYAHMDFDSRTRYCTALAELARHSGLAERRVAEKVIGLCERASAASDGSRRAARRTHVGFYLVDSGRADLEESIGYRPSLPARIRRLILRHPTGFYLAGIELATLFIVFAILYRAGSTVPAYLGLLLLVLPATQAATNIINNLAAILIPPRVPPKLDFSDGIPGDCVTMVAVPTLLLDEAQVRDLVLDLEIRFLANRDRNLYFSLLTDPPDSDRRQDEHDALVVLCARLIEGLNTRYRSEGRSPFFLLHRHRTYNQSEGRWMGWERKRGKLLDLNQMLRGGFDAFPVKVGDLSILPDVRYVITLDSDTRLPRDSAARLVGCISHPLNRAVVDPSTRMVVEGYGILQPRIGISIQSASRSRLAALYSGQTGFDIYTRAVSDVYQDLFGEGIFTGKAIYEVDTLREVLEGRFPENALLSHDLIEGAYARAGLVSDIELIDDYPSHFSAYSRRKHRWMRGDWQIMRWIESRVPDFRGRKILNPITLLSQWKILDNLRRSLLEPGLVLLFLGGWLWLPGRAADWTAAAVLMWCVPVLTRLLFSPLGAPRNRHGWPAWVRDTARGLRESALIAMCGLIFLLHQTLVALDAAVRAVGRALVTKRKLLEWETAAESEANTKSKATVDIYLEWTPWIAIGLAAAIWLLRPAALPAAAPLLILWAGSRAFSTWLNRRPRAVRSKLHREDVLLLRESADRIWRFFHDWSSASTNWLIPDSVHEDGAVDLRLSPTNLGMLLNARVAAVHLGALPLAEFVFATRQTLQQVIRLPKYKGHLFNWYDITSLSPIAPLFVSTVDSGNLGASLWTLKQASLAFASESATKRGVTKGLAAELRLIAEQCHALVREMDFRFLFQRRKRTFSVGYDVTAGRLEPASYSLLASEARTASFVAVAKGDAPQESWFRLGRAHTLFRGEPVLLSWTGTMFEYLMPSLWMRHYSDTIMDQSMKTAVRAQRDYGRRRGVPWGISECAFLARPSGEYGYAAFGIPELAMKRKESRALVISPYSTFLAAGLYPAAALDNLRRMQEFGWFGRYGFYEAVDYSRAGADAIRMWMAHHQGMSLLAIVNLLFDGPVRRCFHAEPQVMATELLLHERVPSTAFAEADRVSLPDVELLPA